MPSAKKEGGKETAEQTDSDEEEEAQDEYHNQYKLIYPTERNSVCNY